MPKKTIFESRRRTPWTGDPYASELERFIDSRNCSLYEARHPELLSSGEAGIINSITPDRCPRCGSDHIQKYGTTRNGVKRYMCAGCGRSFNPLTGTIFDNHKISISEWIEFLEDLLRYESFIGTSKINRNGYNTTRYWIEKVFILLDGYFSDVKLSGTVYLDETYYSEAKGDLVRVDGRLPRGLNSANQICIAIACDGERMYARRLCKGIPTSEMILECFCDVISKGSRIIHDGAKSHGKLIDSLGLDSEVHIASELKGVADDRNPLNPINQACNSLQNFFRGHSGFNREDIQDFINLWMFIVNPGPNGEVGHFFKVKEMLDLALNTKKSYTYSNFMHRNSAK